MMFKKMGGHKTIVETKYEKSQKKSKKSGQVAIEYMTIFGFAFLLLIPLVILFVTQTNQIDAEIFGAQGYKSVSEIIDSAEEMYFMGAPSKKTIRVYFPKHIETAEIRDNAIFFDGEIIGDTTITIIGTLKPESGLHTILIEATDTAVVITDK